MPQQVTEAIRRNSYCALATASAAGRPHVVGVLYAFARGCLYVITERNTTKVRNVEANPKVAVCIPVRKYPLAPPFSIQFRGSATVLPRESPEIESLLKEGALKRIVGFGILKRPGMCFLKVAPARRVHTWGLGVPILQLLRNPVGAERTVEL